MLSGLVAETDWERLLMPTAWKLGAWLVGGWDGVTGEEISLFEMES